MQFRSDIQGLRALAFLLIFFFHLNKHWLPGGFLGVDLFFVISGFLMTTIMLADIEKGRFTFINFYLKRIKRIVPAYYVLLLIVAFVGAYLWLYSDIKIFNKKIKYSAIFISNRLFAAGDNYFEAESSENPLLHTWSLSIEIQFYIILPFIVYFLRKHLVKVFAILIVVFTIYATYQIEFQNLKTGMYFSLLSRIPEFLLGGIYALIFKNGIDVKRNYNNLLAFGSLIILLACSVFISGESNFPGVLALIPCVAGANFLVLKNNFLSGCLSNKVPVYIGELSYSLYLWHFPVMAFLRYKNDSYDFNIQEVIFISLATFALAWLSYFFVESKLRTITEVDFFKIVIPLVLFVAGFSFCLPKITKYKEIPDRYAIAFFGINSHDKNFTEKFGDISKNDSILLIGDSHALMMKPFLDYIGKENHFSYRTLTCDSYPAIEGIKENEVSEHSLKFYRNAMTLVKLTKKLIENSNIIIINSFSFVRNEQNSSIPSLQTALEKLIQGLRKNQKLILINTFPRVGYKNPLRINDGLIKKSSYAFKIIFHNDNRKYLTHLAEKYNNVYFYDLSKSKIFEHAPYINDTVAYYNEYHINTFASIKMAKDLDKDFMAFFNRILESKQSRTKQKVL